MSQPPAYPPQPNQPYPQQPPAYGQPPVYGYPQQPLPPQPYGYQQQMSQQPYPPQPAGPVYAHQMRRQSIGVHLLLLFTTAGLGNIVYAMWAKSKVAARWKA
jgi:hypothetical protein